ncbi:MAG: hypothetical protein A3I66_02870 [Burkholderiales bacterium RIFCSPLOWO2_02_FULL_57_36]|nr:MAG: hypothetical protein A3I66_02870 [Burkholderiales bacterium RIFCSPLOWO2_02_FULL_57_36]
MRSPSGRSAALQNLVSLATALTSQQIEEFSSRLTDALLNLSEQTVRPNEATLSFDAFNHLRINSDVFTQGVAARLSELLLQEARRFEAGGNRNLPDNNADLSLVSFEEMENKVLLSNVSQALERDISEIMEALNLRIGWLYGRDQMSTAENPFRPQVFVRAIYEAWAKIDPVAESHQVILRLLGPELFLPLKPMLLSLNDALIEQNVLPDLSEAYRQKRAENKIGMPPPKVPKRDASRYNRVRDWLLSKKPGKQGQAESAAGGDDLNVPDLFAPATEGGSWGDNTISVKVGPRLFGYLTALQSQMEQLGSHDESFDLRQGATTLRKVKDHVPAGSLTHIDENTIELLAKIFDYVFLEQDIPDDMKRLIARLQIPLLKAALLDKKFFITDNHPARQLIDALAKSGRVWDQTKGHDDPLYKMVEQIVERVQKEFTQQMSLFSDVVSNLESFLAAEEKLSESVLAEPIAVALRQERMRLAQESAEHDVSVRVETGEVAGFVEVFLEAQWTRILTLAHSVKEQKPEVLRKALTVMDDLVWSVKPKTSPEQRKELITKLPSILAMVNAWLNAIKWNEPERVVFFSSLAERHAALVRVQSELSPRHQIETAVNVAQKASERRMSNRFKNDREKRNDEFTRIVEDIAQGSWMEFARNNGERAKFKLTWISPRRNHFIFTNRVGEAPFSFTADELAQILRDRSASMVTTESIVDRALATALDEAE